MKKKTTLQMAFKLCPALRYLILMVSGCLRVCCPLSVWAPQTAPEALQFALIIQSRMRLFTAPKSQIESRLSSGLIPG